MKQKDNYLVRIPIPTNVKIVKENNLLTFSGPLGVTLLNLSKIDCKGFGAIQISENGKTIHLLSKKKDFFGSISSLINNKIYGVNQGFLQYLRIIGVGFRANLDENVLSIKLGFSHDVKYYVPAGVQIFLVEPTLIGIYGIDKNQVSQTAANIRQIKPPSVYKGKGIRFFNENVSLKEGKQK